MPQQTPTRRHTARPSPRESDPAARLAVLGGRTAGAFMRTYWQRRPLLIRRALTCAGDWMDRSALLALAARDDVESRLVVRDDRLLSGWSLRHGPLAPRALPARKRGGWTVLVQGVDLHVQAAHDLLQRFRFMAQARLDDIMISYATEGGGVGPHTDNYDVFLLQMHGRRRWRWGPARSGALVPDVPLKLLADFAPRHEAVLEPGDMLYLPPHQAHDGVAVDGDCMTCSIGFRAPTQAELVREVLARLSDGADESHLRTRYRDAGADVAACAAAVPPAMVDFARAAVAKALAEPAALDRAVGEYLTEPKAQVWFDRGDARRTGVWRGAGVRLDRRTRMLHDAQHVYLNGEAYRIGGRDARMLRRLADERVLHATDLRHASAALHESLADWCAQGWMHWDNP